MERRALQADEYVAAARRSLDALRGLHWVSPAGVAFQRQLGLLAAELGILAGTVDSARHDVAQARIRAAALRTVRELSLAAALEHAVAAQTSRPLPGNERRWGP